ncbi:MAG: exodeoxyribonuclease VII large subunit [Desulfobacterales bacterium]|nr:exodeoxyribonuclease VII large subunit [Desulfobacterales bacterium]
MTEKRDGHIYTVTKLTRQIKNLLEENFPFVWIAGEISNYALPASGHSYFTLKDSQAVIQAVMFKNQKRSLKFNPENGMKVFGLARISLYEPRGSYQLIFEHLEPEGAGSAQIAFEQLKAKLSDNGFFDESRKKQIPFLSECVCLITSKSGAALQDMLNISQRRFPNACIEIIPVTVQGESAVAEICSAIELANTRQSSDLIILARGGGSLEDLAAFNSEPVAEAIYHSDLPIMTGIGHETDYTIADFVADVRAPTPSAAAELAFQDKSALLSAVTNLARRLNRSVAKQIADCRERITDYQGRLKSPETLLYNYRYMLDDYENRLVNCMRQSCLYHAEKLKWVDEALTAQNPHTRLIRSRQTVEALTGRLTQCLAMMVERKQALVSSHTDKLEALNPGRVLERGYAIARRTKDKTIITRAADVKKKDIVDIILHKGRLTTEVKESHG